MEAKIVANAISVIESAVCEGILCLTVDCHDYDHYASLPHAVSYEGKVCGKTGWNSDKNRAYYMGNAKVAYTL